MSDVPDLGPAPERIDVETAQVRRLIESQFPSWADLPVERVANSGWDNRTFHLGSDMLVRLPSATEYAQAVEKEHRWLPTLAPHLPLPIPTPLALGALSSDYPYLWSIYRWLDGHTASHELIARQGGFATDLAGFLAALQAVDAADGPQPGIHNWFRGGALRAFDNKTRRALEDLKGHIDVDLASRLWAEALSTPWEGVDR